MVLGRLCTLHLNSNKYYSSWRFKYAFCLTSACAFLVIVCKHCAHSLSALVVWCLGNFGVSLVLTRCVCVGVCVGGINPYSVWLRRAHRLAVRSAIMAWSCASHACAQSLKRILTYAHVVCHFHWHSHTCESTQRHIVRNTHLPTVILFLWLRSTFSLSELWKSVFIFLKKYYQQFRDHISKLEISMNRIQTGPVMQRQTQKVQKHLDYRYTRPLTWTMHYKLSMYHATKVWSFINKELMNWSIFISRHNSTFWELGSLALWHSQMRVCLWNTRLQPVAS